MELILQDKDYVRNESGGFARAVGEEELLQRVLFRLTARRGAFPLLPTLGSRIYLLPRYKFSQWEALTRQFAAEALADEPELSVTGVTVTREGDGAWLEIALKYAGGDLSVTVEV